MPSYKRQYTAKTLTPDGGLVVGKVTGTASAPSVAGEGLVSVAAGSANSGLLTLTYDGVGTTALKSLVATPSAAAAGRFVQVSTLSASDRTVTLQYMTTSTAAGDLPEGEEIFLLAVLDVK
jgi:hypothetical protein